jgi:membrane protein DedA with SNARE-associated domain
MEAVMEERHPGDEGQRREARRQSGALERLAQDRRGRIVGGAVLTLVLLVLCLGTLALQDRFKGLGYVGVFVVNLSSTGISFLFIPGLTLAGQALILSEARSLGPVQVGLVGGLGMGLGEITAYVVGSVGRDMAHGRQVGGPAWFRKSVDGTGRAISWLLARYGALTLFLLAALPNPLFEVAGFSAGAVRMRFWRFLAPVVAGKLVRGLVLAFLGYYSRHILGI